MQFLLTNDDGIDAFGLKLLEGVLASHGQVTVVAPDTEQSGVGHRVSTRGALKFDERAPLRYALAGTPADCTRVGLRALGIAADWVIAGLNHGGNLGVDIHMSGTVAGAREGAILGCGAIAISQVTSLRHPPDPDRIRLMTARVISELLARPLPAGQLYNVNLPFDPESDAPELTFCEPDPSPHDVRYDQRDGAFTYAGVFLNRPRITGRDVDAIMRGKIAISVLSIV